MIDLIGAVRGIVLEVLSAAVDPAMCAVFDDLPQGTQPPFLKIGAIDSKDDSDKVDDAERITVEVIGVYRGADRGELIAMLHAAKEALHRKRFANDVAIVSQSRRLNASVSDASQQDGITYAAVSNFELLAQPA